MKNILLFVSHIKESNLSDIAKFSKETGKNYRILLLRPKNSEILEIESKCDIVLRVNFDNPINIAESLQPYQSEILVAAPSNTENSVPLFMRVIPNVPYVKTPTTESLIWATDKYEMRRRLHSYDKNISPRFTRVRDYSKKEIVRIVEKVGFPMIVKPANLSASSYVTINYHVEDLEKNLKKIFKGIAKAYQNAGRDEAPKIIAEGYMDGLMYSVDSYVNGKGEVFHCPLVRVKVGKDIGHDDFYNYIRITPTNLGQQSVAKAELVAESAIHALGLRNTTAHIELMRVDDEWKIIEIGARRGGFREIMHSLSCGINHTMNDIFIRSGRKPVIPKKCQGYCVMMQKFADDEGKIIEMKGIKKIEQLKSFHAITVNKKIGDRAVFARNGGRSVFNLFMYNTERSGLLADIRRVEQLVEIKVAGRSRARTKK